MPEVYESVHVGALMDIGHNLKEVNESHSKRHGFSFGAGYADHYGMFNESAVTANAMNILNSHPEVWYNVVRANLELTKIEQGSRELEPLVMQLVVSAVAWLTDIRERNTMTMSSH